jgi:ElaA protein
MRLEWDRKRLAEISPSTLFELLKLRQEVFIIEQYGRSPDMDEIDHLALHLFGIDTRSGVQAYCRLFDDSQGGVWRIQRVVVAKPWRCRGIGLEMLRHAVDLAVSRGALRLAVNAQFHAKSLYESVGFAQTSAIYDDDGIPHVKMSLELMC